MTTNMNASVQLAYRPTFLDRIAWFLTGIGVRSKVMGTAHLRTSVITSLVKAMTLRNSATAREFQPILERATSISSSEWAFATESGGRKGARGQ
ncbi:MAG: hypothetical protein IPG69_07380 [Flavobacteriales bacterium]|nr:hypothetical protein [Flavobacteriales bacterium]